MIRHCGAGRCLILRDIIDALQELRPGILVEESSPGDENDVSYGGSRSRMDVFPPAVRHRILPHNMIWQGALTATGNGERSMGFGISFGTCTIPVAAPA